MGAMTGLSRINFEVFADKFDFSKFQTLCDVGGGNEGNKGALRLGCLR